MSQDSSLKAEWGKREQRDVQRQKRIVKITIGRASEEPAKRHKQKMEPVYFPTMQSVQHTVLNTPLRGMKKSCRFLAKDPQHSSEKSQPPQRSITQVKTIIIIVMPTQRTTWKRQNWRQEGSAKEERSKVKSASNIPQTTGRVPICSIFHILCKSQSKVLTIFGKRS